MGAELVGPEINFSRLAETFGIFGQRGTAGSDRAGIETASNNPDRVGRRGHCPEHRKD
jgi:hypothetical protein